MYNFLEFREAYKVDPNDESQSSSELQSLSGSFTWGVDLRFSCWVSSQVMLTLPINQPNLERPGPVSWLHLFPDVILIYITGSTLLSLRMEPDNLTT